MKKTFKKYFIPHAENNFEPHILRAKRFWFYSALAVAIKAVIIVFVLLMPAQAFLMPDILAVEQGKIILLTNNFRVKNHLATLSENPKLKPSAMNKAADMARYKYFSHIGPDERHLGYFLGQVKYDYLVAGENLAMGYFNAVSMVRAWQASPTHRAILLDTDFAEIGVAIADGVYENAATIYAAQHFGQPRLAVNSNVSSSSVSVVTEYPASSTTTKQVLAIKNFNASIRNSTADGVVGAGTSAWRKYEAANNMLGSTEPVFGLSKMLYAALFALFAFALLLNVFVEIKIQHKYAVVRTLAMLGILSGLWFI